MKKITLSALLLVSAMGFSQTFAVYTEDTNISPGVTVTFANNGSFVGFAPNATANYEGVTHMKYPYATTAVGSDSWFMGSAVGTATDLSAYATGYYNIALKTTSPNAFYLRLKGSGGARIAFTPGAFPYGFNNDGLWHFMSIPVVDFVQYTGTFNIAAVTDFFVLRSFDPTTLTVQLANNDFEVDNIYFSANKVLSTKDFKTNNVIMYPNPASSEVSFSALSSIDSIIIHNLLGQKVLEVAPKSTNARVNISSLASGSYVVSLKTEGKTLESKIVKK